MAMFSKLKQIKNLRQEAKQLQNSLAQESVTETALGGDLRLTMDGNQQIKEIMIAPTQLRPDNKDKLEKALKEAFNKTVKSVQKVMAKKMQKDGSMESLSNISELLK